MKYKGIFKDDIQVAEYCVDEDNSCPFQLLTITGTLANGRDLLVSKVDISVVACLDAIPVFADTAPRDWMAAEELLAYIGFAVQEGVRA